MGSAFANDVLRSEVMLCTHDVALRANGMRPFARCAEHQLYFNEFCAVIFFFKFLIEYIVRNNDIDTVSGHNNTF